MVVGEARQQCNWRVTSGQSGIDGVGVLLHKWGFSSRCRQPPWPHVIEALCGALQEMYHVDFLNKGALAPDADELTAAANTPGSRAGIGASRHTGLISACCLH